jgi:hypothetical protein
MRYKAMFAAGLVVGFIAGTRAGRERYDQLISFGRKVAEHPAVQKTTQAATAKATDLTKAAAKAPGLAKTATAQMPKITAAASAAKQQAASHIPFVGGKGPDSGAPGEEPADAADPQVPYRADGAAASSYDGVQTVLSGSPRVASPGVKACT